jgi:hypothetical protein
MKHELKIIIRYEDEGIDNDCNQITPITCGKILVTHDDQPIGCIQHIKLEASSNDHFPQIEISFPDFSDPNIWTDQVYLERWWSKEIRNSMRMLNTLHNVQIKYENPLPKKDPYELEEVGTDGVIDHIAVKLP